jgi:DNA-binding MarR family transcriptional regulator
MLASKQITWRLVRRPSIPAAPPTPDTDTAVRLRAVIGRLSRHLRPTAAGRAAGLAPTHVSVLLRVVREGPTRLAEIAEAEGLNPTMLSRAVSQLVDAGLLERTSDERDRRAAWIRATRAGAKLAERMRRERTAAVDAALAGLDEPERRDLEDALPALERLAEELRGRRRP